jgi:hypothetical protein
MSVSPARSRSAVPGPALAAVVLAAVGALPVLYVAAVIWLLGGMSADGSGRGWALLPLAGAVGQVAGAVQLRRRRSWLLLALGCVPAVAFLGWHVLVLVRAAPLETGPTALLVGVLLFPLIALVLAFTAPVRRWVGSRR